MSRRWDDTPYDEDDPYKVDLDGLTAFKVKATEWMGLIQTDKKPEHWRVIDSVVSDQLMSIPSSSIFKFRSIKYSYDQPYQVLSSLEDRNGWHITCGPCYSEHPYNPANVRHVLNEPAYNSSSSVGEVLERWKNKIL